MKQLTDFIFDIVLWDRQIFQFFSILYRAVYLEHSLLSQRLWCHQIVLTHEHADATLGLDDIRAVQPFSPTNDIDPTPVYLTQYSMDRYFDENFCCLYMFTGDNKKTIMRERKKERVWRRRWLESPSVNSSSIWKITFTNI